jgi:hypothetical protein
VEWALAHLKLAKLYDEAGEATNAEASCLKLLTIWKDADSDLPPLLEARLLLWSPIETR